MWVFQSDKNSLVYPLNLTFNGGRERRSQIQNPSRTNGRAGRGKKTSGLRRGQHKLNLELRYLRLKGV